MFFNFTGKTKNYKQIKFKETQNTQNGSVFWLAENAAFPDENIVFSGTCIIFEDVSMKGNFSVEDSELLPGTEISGNVSLKNSTIGPNVQMKSTCSQNNISGEIVDSQISDSVVSLTGVAPNHSATTLTLELKSSEIRNTKIKVVPSSNRNNLLKISESIISADKTNISLELGGNLSVENTNISGKTVFINASGNMFFDFSEIFAENIYLSVSQSNMRFSRCRIFGVAKTTSFLSDSNFSDCFICGEMVSAGGKFENTSFCGILKAMSPPIIEYCDFGEGTVYDDFVSRSSSIKLSKSSFSNNTKILFQGGPKTSHNICISNSTFSDNTKIIVSKDIKIVNSQCSENSVVESCILTNSKIYGYANLFRVELKNCTAYGSAKLGFTFDGQKIEGDMPHDQIPSFSDRVFSSKDDIIFVKIRRQKAPVGIIRSVLTIDSDGFMCLFGRDCEEYSDFKSILDNDVKILTDLLAFKNFPILQCSKRQLDSFLVAISSDIIKKYLLNINIDIVFMLLKLYYVCMLYDESLLSDCSIDTEKYKYYWNLLEDTGRMDDCKKIFNMFNETGIVDIFSGKIIKYQYKMIIPELLRFSLGIRN